MTLTIDVEPELEARLRGEAAPTGQDANHFIVSVLKECLREARHHEAMDAATPPSYLRPAETDLLLKVNEGLPPETWQRYNALLAKRRAETLTPDEHAGLIALSNQIEEVNARRIGYLVELARLRGTSLPTLMDALGIKPLTSV